MQETVTLEWWQLLVLAVAGGAAGGILAILSMLVQHVLTTHSATRGEERANERVRQTEARQVRREMRRERVQPVTDYLKKLQEYVSRSRNEETIRELHAEMLKDDEKIQTLAEQSGVEPSMVREVLGKTSYRDLWMKDLPASRDLLTKLLDAFYSAILAAPTAEIQSEITATWSELLRKDQGFSAGQRLSDEIEAYVADTGD